MGIRPAWSARAPPPLARILARRAEGRGAAGGVDKREERRVLRVQLCRVKAQAGDEGKADPRGVEDKRLDIVGEEDVDLFDDEASPRLSSGGHRLSLSLFSMCEEINLFGDEAISARGYGQSRQRPESQRILGIKLAVMRCWEQRARRWARKGTVSMTNIMVRSWPKSWSNHGRIMVESWSNHNQYNGQIRVESWSNHGRTMAKRHTFSSVQGAS